MGAFGLKTGSGDFLPSIRINGKDGTIERSTWDGTERGLEALDKLVCLMDFDTLRVGWIEFTDKGPDKRLVAIGDPLPDSPSEKHKQGIQVIVLLPGELGCHEICSTAIGVVSALEGIYESVLAAPESKQGKVPVIELSEFKKEKTKHGARAVPVFNILDWKDRPQSLASHAAKPRPRAAMPSSTSSASKPSSTGSTQMTPPAAAAKPAQAPVPDFG